MHGRSFRVLADQRYALATSNASSSSTGGVGKVLRASVEIF
jgi:hypothetical protein